MTPPRKRTRYRDSNGRFISSKVNRYRRSNSLKLTTMQAPTVPGPRVPPAAAVLGVTELLEKVLIELDPKTLLLSQRVSKSWRALITSSIRLQRALFLEPTPCGEVSYIDWRLDDKDWYDGQAGKLDLGVHVRGPDRDQRPLVYESHWGKTRDDQGRYRVFVNPLLKELFPFLTKNGIYWNENFSGLPKAAQAEEASWRRMYFTQPPIRCMAVEYDSKDDDEDDVRLADWTIMQVRSRTGAQGLTMMELFDELDLNGYAAAWIEGRHLWEDYTGARDLARIVRDEVR